MQLNERKLLILQAIIDDYIKNAEPVGSRTIARRHNIGISSATIRNEMSDLEELGFLEQPHTSAGRIPSDKGYRLYVDQLMQLHQLSSKEIEDIKKQYNKSISEMEQIIVKTAKMLSHVTKYTCMVLSPQIKQVLLKHIQLVSISDGKALVIIVTNLGIIKDLIISIPENISTDILNKISLMLTEKFGGYPLQEIDFSKILEIKDEITKNREAANRIIDVLNQYVTEAGQKEIYLEGASNIFNFPEYNNILKARAFLTLMEEKETLINLLTNSSDHDIRVIIGKENKCDEAKDYSMVTTSYKIGDLTIGNIGLIGPKRMEYSKVISILHFTTNILNQLLTQMHSQ